MGSGLHGISSHPPDIKRPYNWANIRKWLVCFNHCMCAKLLQPCVTLCDPMDCSPTRLLCSWDSPSKNSGVSCRFFLQRIFLTQGLNPRLLGLLTGGFFTTNATWEAPFHSLEGSKMFQMYLYLDLLWQRPLGWLITALNWMQEKALWKS